MEYKKYKKYDCICILDTETTDIYWNACGPIQIAAEIIDNEGNVVSTFNKRIKTTWKIKPEASAVHGIYAKDLVNCPGEIEVLTEFVAWLMGNGVEMILTYNGEAFDRPMLESRCQKLGIKTNFFSKEEFPGIDVHTRDVSPAKKMDLFGLKQLGRKWKLTLVSEMLGISSENAHDALADVEMTRKVFMKLDPIIHPEDWE